MDRSELESTARISLAELTGLLDTMPPVDQQRITARTSIKEVEAELERQERRDRAQTMREPVAAAAVEAARVAWDDIMTAAIDAVNASIRQRDVTPPASWATRGQTIALSFAATLMVGVWAVYFLI